MRPEQLDEIIENRIRAFSLEADLAPDVMRRIALLEERRERRRMMVTETVLLCVTLALSAGSLFLVRAFSRVFGPLLTLYWPMAPSISIAVQGFFIFLGVGSVVAVMFFFRVFGRDDPGTGVGASRA